VFLAFIKKELSVHADSVAVRVAIATGAVTLTQRDAIVPVKLYGSGTEAAEAGLADLIQPGARARAMIDRLVRKGGGAGCEGV
jgi:hypothetical protein